MNTYDAMKKKRNVWQINPKPRVVTSKKKYDRQLEKKLIKKFLKEEDF